MANIQDVAQYILEKQGEMTTWKLQKLVFYSHAWHLVWDDEPLFLDRIEAWANGPVIPALYQLHSGRFRVSRMRQGDSNRLRLNEKETIDAVLREYGNKTPQWLSDLTHREAPWRDARRRANLAAGDRGNAPILNGALVEYYGGL